VSASLAGNDVAAASTTSHAFALKKSLQKSRQAAPRQGLVSRLVAKIRRKTAKQLLSERLQTPQPFHHKTQQTNTLRRIDDTGHKLHSGPNAATPRRPELLPARTEETEELAALLIT
jgi:hypothetical protein